ncbi:MAG: MFS transporter [Ilumatobacteraceae bacterium]
MSTAAPRKGFRWDRLTVATVAGYCMQICAVSVGVVFSELREQFGISAVVTALHGSMFGFGLLVMGATGVPIVDRLGRRAAISTAFALVAAGVAVFCLGPAWPITLLGTAVSGLGGALWVLVAPGLISDHHGPNRAPAFAAVNGVPALAAIAFSIAIGATLSADAGWRAPYALLTALVVAATALAWRSVALPDPARHSQFTLRHFADRSVFVPWARIVNVVLAEFTIGIWAVTYLREVGGASAGAAPLLAVVFGLMMFAVRMGISSVLRVLGRWTLSVSFAVLGLAAVAMCFAGPLWARVAALTVAGIGGAPLYPLIVDRFYDTAGHRLDSVGLGAYSALASGVGVLVGPLLVGVTADLVGLRWAVLVITALAAIGVATLRPTPR